MGDWNKRYVSKERGWETGVRGLSARGGDW